jgi:glycosyltransferase involved in cell wall biosynthesis
VTKPNIRIYGTVPDDMKNMLLGAADLGINPMFFGSGTNIKMFDFLAAGLPTIATPTGARGIDNDNAFIVAEAAEFPGIIGKLLSDRELYNKLSRNGPEMVRQRYDWNKISYRLGMKMLETYDQHAPYFSIVIPTIRGPEYVGRIFQRLNAQSCHDFEVVLVDTSGGDHELAYQQMACFPLKYLSRDHYGPGKARNEGIRHCRGSVVAFTDDDCLPDANWLANAQRYLEDEANIGLEGYIATDETKLNDTAYRTITNKNFEGMGFMTANLFIRKAVLKKIGGFDNRFERAFREDTDLAWRALSYGNIPYGKDVVVYHPPHKREILGESSDERDKMFAYDALLFAKHPERFIRLIKIEGHYKKNKNYWKYFTEGYRKMPKKGPIELLLDDKDLRQFVPYEFKEKEEAK